LKDLKQAERIFQMIGMWIIGAICTASAFQAQNVPALIVLLSCEWVSLFLSGIWFIVIVTYHEKVEGEA